MFCREEYDFLYFMRNLIHFPALKSIMSILSAIVEALWVNRIDSNFMSE